MKSVLFFSPYTPWIPHTMWEITLAYAIRQRGHSARFITCQGLPDCGMAPVRTHTPEMRCKLCRGFTERELPKVHHTAEYMQAVLTDQDRKELAAWAQSLRVEEFSEAQYQGLPLGKWVWTELLNCWNTPDPDLGRPEVAQSYRDYLLGAATAAVCLPRLFERHQPDVLVTLNGVFFLHRVALELAKARGIRVVTHERGLQDNTLTLNVNAPVWNQGRFERMWREWKEVALTAGELRAVERLLTERRRGQNMGWWAFSPSPQDLQQVRAAANLPDQPMALLCTSSECEASMATRAAPISQREWIERTVAWFGEHPEYTLVIRIHPHEEEYAKIDDRVLRRYEALKASAPQNVRVILPQEEVSTYSLMDLASAGLTYGTTAGLEMACLGLPIVHAGVGFYKESGFTYEVNAPEDIPSIMVEVMERGRSLETQRLAYRFLYRYFLGMSIPFSKVRVASDFINAEICYQSTAELAPGRDRNLDRLVDYILGESELYPPPTPLRALESPDAEDRFFAEQRIAGLLEAARRHPDRSDLLIEAADRLRDLGRLTDAAAVYAAAQRHSP